MDTVSGYGIIILAAGSSSRLGTPKQLLKFQNKTLIRRLTEAALEVVPDQVVIVTGAIEAEIQKELADLNCHFTHNGSWAEGMGLSVAAGIGELVKISPDVRGALLAVSDQPFVDSALLGNLSALAQLHHDSIIASAYANTLGTPVLFPRSYFPQLSALKGTEGAKKLLKSFPEKIVPLAFPQGEIDIDTQADYQRLLNS